MRNELGIGGSEAVDLLEIFRFLPADLAASKMGQGVQINTAIAQVEADASDTETSSLSSAPGTDD